MNEEGQKIDSGLERTIEARLMPWRFGFAIVFSLFLIVTFVYYLPLRFIHQMGEPAMEAGEHVLPGRMHVAAQYHEEGEVREGTAVNLNVTPVPVSVGTTTRLDFFVNEKPGNIPVPAEKLEIEHTKIMHVIGVRDDLNEFFHIHPEDGVITRETITAAFGGESTWETLTPEEREALIALTEIEAPESGVLSAFHIFEAPGRYKVWSEIKKDGVNHTFGHPEIRVRAVDEEFRRLDPRVSYDKQVSFGRNAIVGPYQVSLELEEPVAKGHPHELAFDIHTVTGDEVAVEPYLDAAMHLTIIRDDWKQFIHTHPAGDGGGDHHGTRPGIFPLARAHGNEDIPGAVHDEAGEDEVVRFAVTFPEAGLYRAFAQFRPRGIDLGPDEALLASFWIQVGEKAPAAVSDKVLYTALSLVLIGLLSWGVHKFLQTKS